MSGAADLKSINCTNCGAGLPVLGGGRVTTQICGYCGASLDATDNFNVLDVYAGMARPDTPFQLGMEGEIDGVTFTITGIKGMREPGYGEWVDHMLFSPTHGYAWLTLEDGHCIFTRKARDLPSSWLTSAQVEIADNRPSRRFRGLSYSYYETSNWVVDYVEGAFNYRPKKEDRGTTVSLINYSAGGAPQILSLTEGAGGEREVELSRYAAEAPASFGVTPPEPKGVHATQPYKPSPNANFYRRWWGAMTAAAIVLLIVILNIRGGSTPLLSADIGKLPSMVPFEVTDTARPVRVSVGTDLDNSWVEFPIQVTAPDGTPVADAYLGMSYYWGYSDGERWSEGSRSENIAFMAPEPGTYQINLGTPEGEATTNGRINSFDLSARQSVMTIGWPIVLIVLFLILFVVSFFRKVFFSARRAAGSDWTSEDD